MSSHQNICCFVYELLNYRMFSSDVSRILSLNRVGRQPRRRDGLNPRNQLPFCSSFYLQNVAYGNKALCEDKFESPWLGDYQQA